MRTRSRRGKAHCAATSNWRNSFWFNDGPGKFLVAERTQEMATNGTEIAADLRLDEEIFRISKSDMQSLGTPDRNHSKRGHDYRQSENEHSRDLSPEALD